MAHSSPVRNDSASWSDLDTSGHVDARKKLTYLLATSYMVTHGPLEHPGELYRNKGFFAINPIVRYRFGNGIETWLWTGFIRGSRKSSLFPCATTTGAY